MSSCISWIRIYCCIFLTRIYCCIQDNTAGRAGGANPAAGHGTTPGPGRGAGRATPGPGPGTGDLNNVSSNIKFKSSTGKRSHIIHQTKIIHVPTDLTLLSNKP